MRFIGIGRGKFDRCESVGRNVYGRTGQTSFECSKTPLAIGIDHVPMQMQMEITGLQNNVTVKDAFTGAEINSGFMEVYINV